MLNSDGLIARNFDLDKLLMFTWQILTFLQLYGPGLSSISPDKLMINMHKMGNTNTFKVKRVIPTDNRDVTNLQLLYCPITILYCCKEMPIGKIQYNV